MILSNAHTHTPYCDGQTPIGDMIAEAKRLGFKSLGFSGHAHQPFDPKYCMSEENQAKYLSELRALQRSEKGIRLWVGIERDALSDTDRAPFDYVIGSTHYLAQPFEGSYVAVDGDMTLIERVLSERYHGDGLAFARDYYDLHASYIASFKPDIIGHFDLVRKYESRLPLFDSGSGDYLAIALAALERAFDGCHIMEVNTGGMARSKHLLSPYPDERLLNAWREMGGQVTLTSDCHNAAYLDSKFAQAQALIKRSGFKSVTVLGTGESLFEQSEL